MKRGLTALFLLLIMAGCNTTDRAESREKVKGEAVEVKNETATPLKVIGYVAGWKDFDINSVQVEKMTHINYAFANIVDGKAKFMEEFDAKNLKVLTSLRDSKNSDLKILYSIGGWVWSNDFTEASSTAAKRKIFAESSVEVMREYKLDGVDLDWEYPGQIGEDNIFSADDKVNFTLLLEACRVALDKASAEDNRTGDNKYLLTIATGADDTYTTNTNLGEASKYLDFINIMTYDLYNGYDKFTGHHANLNITKKHGPKQISCKSAVDGHIEAGVPANKIVLGVPFYGREWRGVVANSTGGLWQHAETSGSIVSYDQIVREYNTPDYKKCWDNEAQVPYLYSAEKGHFISYETPKSIAIKIEYIKSKGLGGAMFWEYNNDHKEELLYSLYKLIEK